MVTEVIEWIWATEDIKRNAIDANLFQNLEQTRKVAKIDDLNEWLAANVVDIQAAEPVADGLGEGLAAAHREIEELKDKL